MSASNKQHHKACNRAPDAVESKPRILVVAPAWIGDVVIAQSLLMLLRQRYPRARIDVLSLDLFRPILARMSEVDGMLTFPAEHGSLRPAALWHISRHVKRFGYDQAIVLRNNIKSAVVPWLARIPRRTGFLGESRYGLLNDIRSLDRSRLTSRVEEYLALGVRPDETLSAQIPFPELRVDTDNRDRLLNELALSTDREVIAVAPGASFGAAKRWPLVHYTALTRTLVQAGYTVWLLGGAAEYEMGDEITHRVGGHTHNLCGKTSLDDAVDLMAAASCMVGADSGLTHIAAAVTPRVVGLYGPTSPGYAPPLNSNGIRISRGLACSPCGQKTCPLGHNNCMTRIDVASVFAACTETGIYAAGATR